MQFNTKKGIIDLDWKNNIISINGTAINKIDDSFVVEGYDNKVRNPKKLKIILGHGCNYKCSYCLQDDLSSKSNFKEFSVIEDIKKNIDVSTIEKIELWGGEPLLYLDKIKMIVEAFDRPKLVWSMITNGTLLTTELIDYFESLQGDTALAISHDALKQGLLRGKEFLHTKEDVWLRLDQSKRINYAFTVTITNNNFDFFEINNFFKNFFTFYGLKPTKINYALVEGYDNQSAKYVIQGDNLAKFADITERFIDESIDELLSKKFDKFLCNNIIHSYTDTKSVMGYLSYLKSPKVIRSNVKCDLDQNDGLTVDIGGKVRSCQNVGEDYILGTLDKLEDVKLKPVWLSETTKCSTCHVNTLCKGGCPYIKETDFFELNCAQHYTFYSIVQRKAIELLGGWK
jgi:radical SAM protein with 4Fe4S-binding SPASM domain